MFFLLHLHHNYWVVRGLISIPTADLPAAIISWLQIIKKPPAFDPSNPSCHIINRSNTWSEGKKENKMRASDVEEII